MPKAKPKRVAKATRYDWPTIMREYVEGWQNGEGRHRPTLEELAEKHGMGEGNLRRRAAQDGWTDARSMFEAKLTRALEKKAVAQLAHYAVGFNRRVHTIAERLVELVARSLAPYEPPEIGPPRPPPDSLVLRRLASALKAAHEVGRLAIGDAPGVEFEDQVRDASRRVLIHVIPKPPPEAELDDDTE